MQTTLKSKTKTVVIVCPAAKVYEFVSNIENLPQWAGAFAKSISKKRGKWVIETDQGPVGIQMCEKNAYGVLDHYVIPALGLEICVPMRQTAMAAKYVSPYFKGRE